MKMKPLLLALAVALLLVAKLSAFCLWDDYCDPGTCDWWICL